MAPEDLLRLIEQGENSGVEFKRDALRPEQLAREVVAFANFQGGRLLIAELLPVSGSALVDLNRARLTDYLGRVLADEVPQARHSGRMPESSAIDGSLRRAWTCKIKT